ncbi:MAG: hypothetical protein HY553_09255 [Elusimicrobia bacterium]|nr:hypothetical protein [Elusimicrobiota bacterium]
MLLERGRASRDVGGRTRRCFASAEFTLYLFLEPDGSPFGFQLLFPHHGAVHLLSWTPVEQYRFFSVKDDSGGSDHWDYDRSTRPADIGELDTAALRKRVAVEAGHVEPELRKFFLDKLAAARESLRACRFCIARREAGWRCSVCHVQACGECMEKKSLRRVPCAASLELPPKAHRWAEL